jgi:hypothetical protein
MGRAGGWSATRRRSASGTNNDYRVFALAREQGQLKRPYAGVGGDTWSPEMRQARNLIFSNM